MRLIIAGSRHIDAKPIINGILLMLKLEEEISEVISGGADGVDAAGEAWQKSMSELCGKFAPTLKLFRADWERHGRAAGPIRNAEMADYADALLLIWDGKSKGSASMKAEMKKRLKPIYEVVLRSKS